MAKLYYVFWLPRMFHKKLSVLETALDVINEEISDGIAPDVIHHVSIEIDKASDDKYNLKIKSRINESKETTIVLEHIDSSHNGLIQYYYDADNRNREAKFVCEAIPNAIYHLVKSFFHSHEYHHPKGDSTLLAFTSPTKVNIKAKDNDALMYYLRQYENKFRGYRKLAFEKLQFIKERNEENAEEYYQNYLMRHRSLDESCDKALGESLYYETLLYSWYNGSCKHNLEGTCQADCLTYMTTATEIGEGGSSPEYIDQTGKKQGSLITHTPGEKEKEREKELHRLALNAKNAIDSIRIIKQCNKNMFDYKNSDYTIKALEGITVGNQQIGELIRSGEEVAKSSYFAGKVGAVLGVVSVLLGLLAFFPPSQWSDNKKTDAPLEETGIVSPLVNDSAQKDTPQDSNMVIVEKTFTTGLKSDTIKKIM